MESRRALGSLIGAYPAGWPLPAQAAPELPASWWPAQIRVACRWGGRHAPWPPERGRIPPLVSKASPGNPAILRPETLEQRFQVEPLRWVAGVVLWNPAKMRQLQTLVSTSN